MLYALLFACSDYDLSGKAEVEPPDRKDEDEEEEADDPEPDVVVEPLSISFGSVQQSEVRTEVVRVSNDGDAPLTVSDVALIKGEELGYTFTLATALPWVLESGAGEDVVVSFSPYDEGQTEGRLRVTSDDPDEAEVPVTLDSEGDGCFDPSSAYDLHPAAGLVVTDDSVPIIAIYDGSDAGYTSELWLTSPRTKYIATGHESSPGTSVDLGTYDVGTELVFAIKVTDNGQWFYSGPGERNSDGQLHGAVTYKGDCGWTVGFEDSWGGGDQDFNDITMTIGGELEMQIVI